MCRGGEGEGTSDRGLSRTSPRVNTSYGLSWRVKVTIVVGDGLVAAGSIMAMRKCESNNDTDSNASWTYCSTPACGINSDACCDKDDLFLAKTLLTYGGEGALLVIN